MKFTDIFKFKLFERTDQVDMKTVNENFESVEKLFKGLDQVDNTADCDKNVASAKKAECDGNGKNISETYLKKAAVANNNTTTESGFALDARQANPNVDGSLAKQINTLNDGLKKLMLESFIIQFTVGKGIYGWYATNAIYIGDFRSLNITHLGVFGTNTVLDSYYNNPTYDNNGITVDSNNGLVFVKFSDYKIVELIPTGTTIYIQGTVSR